MKNKQYYYDLLVDIKEDIKNESGLLGSNIASLITTLRMGGLLDKSDIDFIQNVGCTTLNEGLQYIIKLQKEVRRKD